MDGAAVVELYKSKKLGENIPLVIDPGCSYPRNYHFIQNGIEGASPRTRKSLFNRRLKAYLGSIADKAGAVAAHFGAVVNVAGAAKHSAALVSSSLHYKHLHRMLDKTHENSGSLRDSLKLLAVIKEYKIMARTARLGAAFIEDIPGIGMAIGYAHGRKLKSLQDAAIAASLDLHWQAYREINMGGASVKAPAVNICRELVCLSATHLSGHQESALDIGGLHSANELNEILKEPCGYMVILYKLTQK